MIKIHKLRLKNFKSFRKAEIPFVDGFTCVVGSNASGKSNILDAIMFVMGATSLKMLRASRMTELVNHDAREDYAKVEVELKDTGKTYLISRTIDKQGKGVYRLDGKRKAMNEVTALLIELGINAKGHNIVAQGDITRIIEMNPKQRREVIDEIAGLSEFEEKKAEALKKLDQVDQKVKGAVIVLKEREAYLTELEREKEAAIKYKQLLEEQKRSKATIISKNISRIGKEIETAKKQQSQLEQEIETKSKEREKVTEDLRDAEKKLEEINDELLKAKEKIYSTIGKSVEEKRSEVKIVSERINSKKHLLENNRNKKSLLKNKLNSLNETLPGIQRSIKEKDAEVRAIEKELLPLEEEEQRKIDDAKKQAEKINSVEQELKEIVERIERDNAKMKGRELEAAAIQKEIELIGKRISELGKTKETMQLQERKKKVEGIGQAAKEIDELLGKISGKNNEIEEIKIKISGIETTANELLEIFDFFMGKEEEKELNELKSGNAEKIKKIDHDVGSLGKDIESAITERNGLEEKMRRFRGIETGTIGKSKALMESKHALKEQLAHLNSEEKQLSARKSEVEKELNEISNDIENFESNLNENDAKLSVLNKELEDKHSELEKASRSNLELEERKQRVSTKIENLNSKKETLENTTDKKKRELNEIAIEFSKNEVRYEDLNQEHENYKEIKVLEDAEIGQLEKRLPQIDKEIQELGDINMRALQSFDEYYKEVEEIRGKCAKLDEERQAVTEMIDKIDVKKMNVFMKCFTEISEKFSKLYFEFFSGEGKLGLTSPENPLEGGLTIEAKYKEDTLKSIDAMSGGEKSLTALSFLFAIQSYEPAPFYIFDEADAALDKTNSHKLGGMIHSISTGSQFIAITHNDGLMKQCDQLIGVALNKQKSSVIGLRLKDRIKKGEKSLEELDESDIEQNGEAKLEEATSA